MRIRCPHCSQPIEVIEKAELTDIECPSCGSSFNLLGDDTDRTQASEPKSLGHFSLQQELGTGAFGSVWKAFDSQLDRVVAVKIPRKSELTGPEAEQFVREAQSAAQLNHPNIVSVHEVGRSGNQLYIVSDLVDGVPLSSWLTASAPSVQEASELIKTIAEALHHAHQKGVIHRDLKPSNIMIDSDGAPHVMDFGLAKRETAEITVTADGAVLGTPAYMAPEQAKGESHRADCRSDVYSLGVIFFELLTGERPFRGDHRMLIYQVLNEDPKGPRSLRSTIPRDVDNICLKCLEKNPERRYPSAHALADDLYRFLSKKPVAARPISRIEKLARWSKRQPVTAGLVVLLFSSLFIGASFSTYFAYVANDRADKLVIERDNAVTAGRLAAEREAEAQLARQKAIEASKRLENQVYLSRIGLASNALDSGETYEAERILLSCSPDLRNWEWRHLWHKANPAKITAKIADRRVNPINDIQACPDGERIAFAGSVGISLASIETLRDGAVLEGSQTAEKVAFDPKGEIVAAALFNRGMIQTWDALTGKPLRTIADSSQRVLAISPDGNLIATSSGIARLYLWDLRSGELQKSIEEFDTKYGVGPVDDIEFHPTEKIVASLSLNTVRAFDWESGEMLYELQERERISDFDFTADGKMLLVATGRLNSFTPNRESNSYGLQIRNANTGELRSSIPFPKNGVTKVEAHPDKNIAAALGWDKSVYVYDLDRQKEIAVFRGHQLQPSAMTFSSDGKSVVTGDQSGIGRLFEIDMPLLLPRDPRDEAQIRVGAARVAIRRAGEGAPGILLNAHAGAVRHVEYASDGTQVLFGGNELGRLHVGNGETIQSLIQRATPFTTVSTSPDGTKLFAGAIYGAKSILMCWDNTNEQILWKREVEQRVYSSEFNPNGETVTLGQVGSVAILDAQTGDDLVDVVKLDAAREYVTSIAYSPNGDWFVTGCSSALNDDPR